MPRPFLKWAGGKRSLINELLARIPEGHIEHYVEPFLGGGALFLHLARNGMVGRATLADRNPELINAWRVVQSEPEALIEAVTQWEVSEETFYEVRALRFDDPLQQAARTLWLNRTCYNGLYRLNSKGQFNVPFGRYKRPRVVDPENIRAVHAALQGVELISEDFESVMDRADQGTVVYCDPPYWPVSKTSRFNFYDGQVFGPPDQRRLSEAFGALPERGAFGLLSNSSTEETRALYEPFDLRLVQCRRSINRDPAKRGYVDEILVSVG